MVRPWRNSMNHDYNQCPLSEMSVLEYLEDCILFRFHRLHFKEDFTSYMYGSNRPFSKMVATDLNELKLN